MLAPLAAHEQQQAPEIGAPLMGEGIAAEGIERHLMAAQQKEPDEVRVALTQEGYPASGESLSRLALNVLLGFDGLSCLLAGMRRPEYVENVMGTVGLERVEREHVLRRFKKPRLLY